MLKKQSYVFPVGESRSEGAASDPAAVGARIREARKALGLTQEQLAALAGGTSNRGVQENEAGKTMPGGLMLAALVRAGVNANWVLESRGEMLLEHINGRYVSDAVNAPALKAILEGVLHIHGTQANPERIVELAMDLYDRVLGDRSPGSS